jgi:hypothetical protein
MDGSNGNRATHTPSLSPSTGKKGGQQVCPSGPGFVSERGRVDVDDYLHCYIQISGAEGVLSIGNTHEELGFNVAYASQKTVSSSLLAKKYNSIQVCLEAIEAALAEIKRTKGIKSLKPCMLT